MAVGDKAGVGVYFEENGFANIRAVANGTAVGSSARASADRASAIGSFAIASGVDSTALGSDAVASAEGSVALGRGSLADQANTVSVGTVDRERRIVNVAAGVGDTDAVIVSQLNAEAAIRADADTTLQNNITAVGTRVDGVEAINAAQQTQISTIQTVNTSQSTQISANTAALSGVQAVNTIQSAQISALSGQFAAFNTNISGIQADIGSLFDLRRQDRSDTRQGIASAIAMGSAPIPSRPGGVSYNVNAARFRGENAIGGSMMYRLNTGSTVAVGAGFSYAGNKNNGVRLGVAGEF